MAKIALVLHIQSNYMCPHAPSHMYAEGLRQTAQPQTTDAAWATLRELTHLVVSLLTSATTYSNAIRSLTAFDLLDWMVDRLGLSRVSSEHSGRVKKTANPVQVNPVWSIDSKDSTSLFHIVWLS